MHKLHGVFELQSYRRQWNEQNATRKMLGFNFVCMGIVLELGAAETP